MPQLENIPAAKVGQVVQSFIDNGEPQIFAIAQERGFFTVGTVVKTSQTIRPLPTSKKRKQDLKNKNNK